MLCDKCGKNNATTHIKQIINGVVTERNLCSSCAAEEGYSKFPHGGTCCPVCGSRFSDIAETGKAGCAECYKTFYSELLPYLKRVHGSVKHVGKVPNSAPLAVKPQAETADSLRLELNRLVSEERFEEAAVVRDKIKKLEETENE